MPTVEESVVIDRPRAEVFAFFDDVDNVEVVNSNVTEYLVAEGAPTGVGRSAKFSVKVAGVRLDYTDETTEWVENERIKQVGEGRIPYSITLGFADEGQGTRVTWHQEVDSLGGVFRFADGVVMKMYARDVRGNLEKAKELLES
jgi:hypothetical protein